MKSYLKKWLALSLAVIMVFSSLPLGALAADPDQSNGLSEDFEAALNEKFGNVGDKEGVYTSTLDEENRVVNVYIIDKDYSITNLEGTDFVSGLVSLYKNNNLTEFKIGAQETRNIADLEGQTDDTNSLEKLIASSIEDDIKNELSIQDNITLENLLDKSVDMALTAGAQGSDPVTLTYTVKGLDAYKPEVETIEKDFGHPVTMEDIKSAITIPAFADVFEVKLAEGQVLPDGKTAGESTVKVIASKDGEDDIEVEVPVQVGDPSDAQANEPTVKPIEKNFGQEVTKEEVKAAVTVEDYEGEYTVDLVEGQELPDGETPGKYQVKVIVKYADSSTDEVDVPVKVKDQTDAQANEPTVVPIEKNYGEGVTEEEVKDAVTVEGYGENLTVELAEGQVLPDGMTAGEHQVKVLVKYADDSTDEVQVTVQVGDPTHADLNEPTVKTIEKNYGEGVTVEEVKAAVTVEGYGENLTVELAEEQVLPDGMTAGEHQVKVIVKYADGSTDEALVDIVIDEGSWVNPGTGDKPEEPEEEPEEKPEDEPEEPEEEPDEPEEEPEDQPEEPEEEPIQVDTDRIAGEDRYETAIEISKASYEEAEAVIIADGANYPDALAASALLGQKNAPILLSSLDNLEAIKAEIDRLGAENIIIIGGENSVSSEEEEALADLASVRRIAGENRYQTALKIAEEALEENPTSKVIVADGRNYADALAAGSYAAREKLPILLADGDSLPGADEVIEKYEITEALVVGGENSVGNLEDYFEKVTRIAGENRYATSVAIAEEFFPEAKELALVSGSNFADALSLAPLAAIEDMPILLTDKEELPEEVKAYIIENEIENVHIFGGENSVGDLFD